LVQSDRTKHIDISYRHVRERVRLHQLRFSHVYLAEKCIGYVH
jgi:hypothetical protein